MTRLRFDECISHRVVAALRALSPTEDLILETPSDFDEGGLEDVDWIAAFAARGGRLVVSGDPNMRNRPPERAALEAAGLIAVFPARNRFFDELRRFGQAAYLIRWFPCIEHLSRNAAIGSHWRLPASFSGDLESIEALPRVGDIGI